MVVLANYSVTNANFANKQLASMYVGGGGLRLYPDCGKLQLDDISSGAFNTIITQISNQSVKYCIGIL